MNTQPIHLTLDASQPGRRFDGVGGNFRLQNPTADPPVIRYNLDNLRVAWGRVAMPLDEWHPNESDDPAARPLSRSVREAMEMAAELSRRKIPVMAGVWVAPDWALGPSAPPPLVGKPPRGRPVLAEKADPLCRSIASYLIHARDQFGAEVEYFSFNESNLGIDVRQTAAEHAEMIKRLGAEFASRGLRTKMLLGDTSDARAIDFIRAAAADAEAMKYVGAISFHSWRGGRDEVFSAWGDVASRLGLPLFCAEGGTDPEAWRHPAVFREPSYALQEIDLYVRICALCGPQSILHWQLTSDYSVIAHGEGLPAPTQRFWQLKQLALTPAGLCALPIRADPADVTCCAFGDGERLAVHVVNMGAAREAVVTGLPNQLTRLRCYVTDAQRGMKEMDSVAAAGGAARFALDSMSFTTLAALPAEPA